LRSDANIDVVKSRRASREQFALRFGTKASSVAVRVEDDSTGNGVLLSLIALIKRSPR
jgi:hypothetical protein